MRRIFICCLDNNACTYYRSFLPWNFCKDQLLADGIELVFDATLDLKEHYDAYVFPRLCTPLFYPALDWLRQRGRRVVWETDDLLQRIPDANPNKISDGNLQLFEHCLDRADSIFVTTPTLKRELRREWKTKVVPNFIDLTCFPDFREQEDEGVVRVVWAGGGSHYDDLEMLTAALLRLLNRFGDRMQLIFFGQSNPYLATLPYVRVVQWVQRNEYAKTLTELQPHIFLAPLTYNRFSSCKSNIKWLEGTAVNAVTVASRFDPYLCIQDKMDGLLCYPDEWYDTLAAVIENLDWRNELLFQARASVEQDWSWQSERCRAVWMEAFRRLSDAGA